MKLFAAKFNIVFLILFMISTPAFSGQLSMWVDENGVTHFSQQPPPADTESETIKYKKTTSRSNPDNFEYLRRREAEREAERNANIRQLKLERESEKLKRDREKQRQLEEIENAKEDYEDYEDRRQEYEENYRDAFSRSNRDYWRRQIKKADEARSKYYKLKNEYSD